MTAQSGGPTIAFSPLGVDHLIVGGVDATPGAWPWQLSLQTLYITGWSHICGACLLSPTKALTAAHCLGGSWVICIEIPVGNCFISLSTLLYCYDNRLFIVLSNKSTGRRRLPGLRCTLTERPWILKLQLQGARSNQEYRMQLFLPNYCSKQYISVVIQLDSVCE